MVVSHRPSDRTDIAAQRILIVLPSWVGDVVMATACLAAIRRRYPKSHIAHLAMGYVADVLEASQLADETILWPPGSKGGVLPLMRLAHDLKARQFDVAVLLTNSFRSAILVRLAGIPRRLGYARDARGIFLTDRLHPPRQDGRFVPVPALDYYNELARLMGCGAVGDQLVLATTAADEAAIDRRLGHHDSARPLIALNPGANFGSAKCWPADKYARLSDELVRRLGARVVASLGPKEKPIADALAAAAREPLEIFVDPPLGLGPLKALIRRCDLLITNDTGPRHFAAAFDVPVVTIFGSSDPAWTDTRFAKERSVMLKLDCQPCMERVCPLKHHNCMNQLEPELVLEQAMSLLQKSNRRISPLKC
jgi:heptosyltransferase-2